MKHGHIQVYIDLDVPYGAPTPANEVVPCTRNTTILPGLAHQKFYVISRRIVDTLSYWPIVIINGKRRLIDGSVPTHLERIPRDALEITGELAEDILHNHDGHHAWACCFHERVFRLRMDARAAKQQRTPAS
jgi:hypothetical protein